MGDSDWNVSGKLCHSGTQTHKEHLVPFTNILIYTQHTSYITYQKQTPRNAYCATRTPQRTLHTTSRSTSSRDSIVAMATCLRGWQAGVQIQAGAIFFFSKSLSRPPLMPTQPPIQMASRTLSQGVQRPRWEADNSPPSSVSSCRLPLPLPFYKVQLFHFG